MILYGTKQFFRRIGIYQPLGNSCSGEREVVLLSSGSDTTFPVWEPVQDARIHQRGPGVF